MIPTFSESMFMLEKMVKAERLVELTAEIVSSKLANSNVPAGEIGALISSVFRALSEAVVEVPATEPERKPAVAIRASVKRDVVVCLECGFEAKVLKRHLLKAHNLSADDYKRRWSLAHSHPLVAPVYAEMRRVMAVKIGLGRKPDVKPTRQRRTGTRKTKASGNSR